MDNFDLKKFLTESKMTRNSRLLAEGNLQQDVMDFLDSIESDNYQRSKDNDPDYEEVKPSIEFFLDLHPEYEGREEEIMPFLNENWQSLGISITPQENAKEMIVSLGSRRLAAEVVDEILKIEVLQEQYKEYWRAVKGEILNNNLN
jgi:hypothetical protein